MANNRIYIKCDQCGRRFCLAKSYGDGFYVNNEFDEILLNEFFEVHAFCMGGKGVGTEGDFSLEYETKPGDVPDLADFYRRIKENRGKE